MSQSDRREFLQEVGKRFAVNEGTNKPESRGKWSMYLDGRWYALSLAEGSPKPQGTVSELDVSVLQDLLLDPILGIKDVRTDKRIEFSLRKLRHVHIIGRRENAARSAGFDHVSAVFDVETNGESGLIR